MIALFTTKILSSVVPAGLHAFIAETVREIETIDASFPASSQSSHSNLLALILASDYICCFALFATACAFLTILIYALRRHYPDLRIWP